MARLSLILLLISGTLLTSCQLLETVVESVESAACPVSPRLPDHILATYMTAPVGEYPIWFVTVDSVAMSELGASLPPYNGGTVRKSLIAVSMDFEGDLVMTGQQIDGDGIVLFPDRIDREIINEEGESMIVYSEDDLSERKVISNAQNTTNAQNPPGYAHHPWSVYYPNPGCYALTGTFGGYSTTIVVEISND